MTTVPLAQATAQPARLSVPWDRRRVGLLLLSVVFLGLSILSLRSIEFSVRELIDGFRTSGYLGRALPPSFEGWQESLRELARTFSMAVAGTGLAAVLSIPLGFLAARNTAPANSVRVIARAIIVGTRAIPDLVFAVFFVVALSIGELPGVLALGIHSIGMLGKLLADTIEECDPGPSEATTSAGGTRLQTIASSVVPQIMPRFLSTLLFRLDINTRVSVVLGFVGAGGIGMSLRQNLRNPLRYPIGIGQAIMVLALILLVDRFAAVSRKALDGYSTVRSQDRESVVDLTSVTSTLKSASASVQSFSVPLTRSRGVLMSLSTFGMIGFLYSSWLVGLNPFSFIGALVKSGKALSMFVPPDFSTHWDSIITGFRQTLALGLAATFLGLCMAIPFALLVARTTTPNRLVGAISRFIQVIIRAIPELVIVLLFISAVGLGPLPGAAALSIATFAFTSKLLSDSLESLPEGPSEGVRATGATRKQDIASAIAPQMVPGMVSTGLYAFDINIRASAVLGIVGAGGIGRILDEANAMLEYETVAAVIIILFALVFAIEQLSSFVRKVLL
jgi:phosphonate transport system permease protein